MMLEFRLQSQVLNVAAVGPKNGNKLGCPERVSLLFLPILAFVEPFLKLAFELPSSRKLGDLENQFPADMSSLDHPMRARCVFQRKYVNRRYVDQSTVDQIRDLPHRLPGSLKVDNRGDLAEASSLRFFPIAFHVTVCSCCDEVDQSAAPAEHVQRLRQGGGPHGVQDDINSVSRPVSNRLAFSDV